MILEIVVTFYALTLFAFFDYWGYNVLHPFQPVAYRILQHLILIVLALGLYFLSWRCSVAFLLLWWTWWADAIYYAFYDSLGWYGQNPHVSAWENEVMEGFVTWAWWTPVGLLTKHKRAIPHNTLMWQLVVGVVVALVVMGV
jgi:hypothetical protein